MVPPWSLLFISQQYQYADTWTGHVASIWHTVWFDQSHIRVCTIALLLPNFVIFQKSVRGGSLVVPPWKPLFISHQYHYAGTWPGHVSSICHTVWSDQLPIRVCTIASRLLNLVILQKSVRGGTLVVPPWYPLLISHQYHYAGTWTGHIASIWHIVWFDQLPIKVGTIALVLLNFGHSPKNGQKGYPSGTPMVPPVHNSSIPVCRHMNRTCSLHMAYSLIWSVTNKGMH